MTVNRGSESGGRSRIRIGAEHIPREETVPGVLVDHTDGQAKFRIRPRRALLDEQLGAVERLQEVLMQQVELRGLHGPVHRAPRDLVFARGLLHQEPIIRGAPGVLTGQAGQRAPLRDQTLAALHSFFIKRRFAEVPSKPGAGDDV